ncbi:MAG: sulfotransferase domain-containing protein [Anaerolineae bacterium]|nr:sulfotransferase domain-containing protein [Anaerolineae bacterium]MDQ7035758.1 sulfotransferase domain-containing protein [Anaerolineae bacterium]
MFKKQNPPLVSRRIDQELVERFEKNPDNPFLVSFPRTGSHWLRMMLELYFERPTLVRAFYYAQSDDFLLRHHHDINLDVQRKNVIYLYRDPVATIYSQLRYEKDPLDDKERITHWSDIYGQHLEKWLIQENFTTKKTIITYEGLKDNLNETFAQVTNHLGGTFDAERLQAVAAQVTKGEVKSKTQHDEQVIQLDSRYEISRDTFREQSGAYVLESALKDRESLRPFFAGIIS